MPGEWVVVHRHHEDEVLIEQRLDGEVASGDGDTKHGQVEASRRQLRFEARGSPVGHDQAELRVAFGEVSEQQWERASAPWCRSSRPGRCPATSSRNAPRSEVIASSSPSRR